MKMVKTLTLFYSEWSKLNSVWRLKYVILPRNVYKTRENVLNKTEIIIQFQQQSDLGSTPFVKMKSDEKGPVISLRMVKTLRFLFDLILYIPVNNLSIILGQVFLCLTNTKQG